MSKLVWLCLSIIIVACFSWIAYDIISEIIKEGFNNLTRLDYMIIVMIAVVTQQMITK